MHLLAYKYTKEMEKAKCLLHCPQSMHLEKPMCLQLIMFKHYQDEPMHLLACTHS